MAAPTGILWSRDPHTAAKHELLDRYLQAWFPIMARQFSAEGIAFVDAFAGPGEYEDGEDGSPLIAMAQARRPDVLSCGVSIRLLLIEKRKDRYDHLRGLLDQRFASGWRPSNWAVQVRHGDCRVILIPALNEIGAEGAPMFVNFDGWGVDTPMSLVRHVGRNPSSEVLVTFKAHFFVRFVTQHDNEAGDKIFGDPQWRTVAASGTPDEKRRGLVDFYRRRLDDAGFPYSLPFEMVDEGGHELFLVYGTSSDVGVGKMKDAMWAVDPAYGQSFRDPRDPNQLAFAIGENPNLTRLEEQIVEVLEDGPRNVAWLQRFALLETVYKPTHVPPALRELEERQKVEVDWKRRHADSVASLAPPRLFP